MHGVSDVLASWSLYIIGTGLHTFVYGLFTVELNVSCDCMDCLLHTVFCIYCVQVYEYMYVCMCIFNGVCFVCTFVNESGGVYCGLCVYVCMFVYIYTCLCLCVCVCVCVFVHVHVCMCVCVCMHIDFMCACAHVCMCI